VTDRIANAEQAASWDGRRGDHWVRYADRYDALIERLTPPLMRAAAVAASDRVVDVGCGCGSTTRMAARAALTGSVLGVDLSAAMLHEAERRTRAEGLGNVWFEHADVQVHAFAPAEFDVALSRFGVMFFEDPVAAFSNLACALRPGGRITFLCWQERDCNEWVTVPVSAALTVVSPPDPLPEGAPGPFSLGKPERIRQVLEEAGFDDIGLSEVAELLYLGDDAADAIDFWQGSGIARILLDDVDAVTERRAIEAVHEALRPHERPEGIRLGSAAWLVSATRA
jgi:ubiquinone/menaquinone biosynthesis C-methylase UbiE